MENEIQTPQIAITTNTLASSEDHDTPIPICLVDQEEEDEPKDNRINNAKIHSPTETPNTTPTHSFNAPKEFKYRQIDQNYRQIDQNSDATESKPSDEAPPTSHKEKPSDVDQIYRRPKNINPVDLLQGRVRWYDFVKGYGYITNSTHDSVYVSQKSLVGEEYKYLKENQVVEFMLESTCKEKYAESSPKETMKESTKKFVAAFVTKPGGIPLDPASQEEIISNGGRHRKFITTNLYSQKQDRPSFQVKNADGKITLPKGRFKGFIVLYQYTKGFGFIQPNDFDAPVFMHISDMISKQNKFDSVDSNDLVEFEFTLSGKGPKATKVEVVFHADPEKRLQLHDSKESGVGLKDSKTSGRYYKKRNRDDEHDKRDVRDPEYIRDQKEKSHRRELSVDDIDNHDYRSDKHQSRKHSHTHTHTHSDSQKRNDDSRDSQKRRDDTYESRRDDNYESKKRRKHNNYYSNSEEEDNKDWLRRRNEDSNDRDYTRRNDRYNHEKKDRKSSSKDEMDDGKQTMYQSEHSRGRDTVEANNECNESPLVGMVNPYMMSFGMNPFGIINPSGAMGNISPPGTIGNTMDNNNINNAMSMYSFFPNHMMAPSSMMSIPYQPISRSKTSRSSNSRSKNNNATDIPKANAVYHR